MRVKLRAEGGGIWKEELERRKLGQGKFVRFRRIKKNDKMGLPFDFIDFFFS